MAKKKVSHKKQRLQNLLERLQSGEDVAVRDLKSALTEIEFEKYEQQWEWQQDQKALGNNGSSGYDDFLKKGLFHYNKAESGRFEKSAARRFRNIAQDCFEKALEQLSADVQSDPMVATAYDRALDFSPGGNLSLDPVGMPRRVISKSLDNLNRADGGVTKRDLKLRAVRQSLADFDSREDGQDWQDWQDSQEGQDSKKEPKLAPKRSLNQGEKLAEMLKKLRTA